MNTLSKATALTGMTLASYGALNVETVSAHHGSIEIMNECAGEGNEARITLEDFAGHNLLSDVVEISISENVLGATKGGPIETISIDRDDLVHDGFESVEVDLGPGEYNVFGSWIVDHNYNGLPDEGEEFSFTGDIVVDECPSKEVPPTTSTPSASTPPTVVDVPNTPLTPIAPDLPPSSEIPTDEPETPTKANTPTASPEKPTLPATGPKKEIDPEKTSKIAGLVMGIGLFATLIARRPRRTV